MMEIIEFSEDWKEEWDKFVESSSNGTMFHMQRFFDYHIPGKFTFNHLIFLDKNRIVALLPGSIVNGNIYESPIGASYGSIVIGDITFKKTMEIVSTLRRYFRVLQVARKPNKEEFNVSAKISAIGIVIIGAIGFAIFLAFIFMGI